MSIETALLELDGIHEEEHAKTDNPTYLLILSDLGDGSLSLHDFLKKHEVTAMELGYAWFDYIPHNIFYHSENSYGDTYHMMFLKYPQWEKVKPGETFIWAP